MLVLGGFDTRVRPTVDAELLVSDDVLFLAQVIVDLGLLRLEVQVVGENTGPWIACPVERRIRMAITFHFLLSKALRR